MRYLHAQAVLLGKVPCQKPLDRSAGDPADGWHGLLHAAVQGRSFMILYAANPQTTAPMSVNDIR